MYLINKDETEHTGQVGKGDRPGGKGGRQSCPGDKAGHGTLRRGFPPDGSHGLFTRRPRSRTGVQGSPGRGNVHRKNNNTLLLLKMLTLGFDYYNVLDLLIDSRCFQMNFHPQYYGQ